MVSGLGTCPSLGRLWLCSNRIQMLSGLDTLHELRELWLQAEASSWQPWLEQQSGRVQAWAPEPGQPAWGRVLPLGWIALAGAD